MFTSMVLAHKKEVKKMYFLEQNVPRCRIFWADGKKFRRNVCTLFFDMPLRRDTTTKVALLAAVLKEGCKSYPSPKFLAIHGEELYGAIWDVSVVKKGDRQLLLVSMDVAKRVEMAEVISFMEALILQPLVLEDGFLPEIVERKKRWLKSHLESLQDDKRAFAKRRCIEETAKGSAYGVSGDGYVEDLLDIDGKNLYAFYLKMIQQVSVSVVFVGDEKDKKQCTRMRKHFSGMAPLDCLTEKGFILAKPNFLLERMEVSQSRLVMGFHTKNIHYGEKSYAAYLVLCRLLGEGADSILFRNLREEKNLCYDVSASIYPLTGLFFVQMGIQEKDAKESVKGVLEGVEQLWKMPVSPKKLEEAKTSLGQEYESISDSPWGIANFVADGILMETDGDLAEFVAEIAHVTQGDVARLAKYMRVQTIYLLTNQEGKIHE